jgi:hypothetical protein
MEREFNLDENSDEYKLLTVNDLVFVRLHAANSGICASAIISAPIS